MTGEVGSATGLKAGSKTSSTSRFRSVRVRVTGGATLALTAVILLTGFLFTNAVRRSESRSLEVACRQRLSDTLALVLAGPIKTPLPAARDSALLVQVLRPDGSVLGSTANVMDMDRPFVSAAEFPVVDNEVREWSASVEMTDVLLTGQSVTNDEGAWPVYVAVPKSSVGRTVATVRAQMFRWAPPLLLLGALLLWFVVGRALRPVDVLRAEVDAIGPAELHHRVSVAPINDEIGRLAATMNSMLDRLQASADRQSRFVSDASHELRSPLAVLRTRLEVALRHPEQADWKSVATTALHQGTRMERLVTDLLTLARTGVAATKAADPAEVDLGDLVLRAVVEARVEGAGKVAIDASQVSGGRVVGQDDLLQRAVSNLLSNAIRHAVSTVKVSVQTVSGSVLVTVEDDGPGVPEQERERIFERFVRLDESRTRSDGGAGLGLAIVAEIAVAHDGGVTVSSSGLGGARFELSLPEA
jgi:signal transduction histidine kinase